MPKKLLVPFHHAEGQSSMIRLDFPTAVERDLMATVKSYRELPPAPHQWGSPARGWEVPPQLGGWTLGLLPGGVVEFSREGEAPVRTRKFVQFMSEASVLAESR